MNGNCGAIFCRSFWKKWLANDSDVILWAVSPLMRPFRPETYQTVDLVATEFTSVVFRILHYRNFQGVRVVQNPENHRNESGGG